MDCVGEGENIVDNKDTVWREKEEEKSCYFVEQEIFLFSLRYFGPKIRVVVQETFLLINFIRTINFHLESFFLSCLLDPESCLIVFFVSNLVFCPLLLQEDPLWSLGPHNTLYITKFVGLFRFLSIGKSP